MRAKYSSYLVRKLSKKMSFRFRKWKRGGIGELDTCEFLYFTGRCLLGEIEMA